MILQSNNPIINAQTPDNGYNPALRALGVAAVGTAGYQAHKYLLRNRPGYAESLYQAAGIFEERTPFKLGYTFRLSERLSSNLINEVHAPYSDLVSRGELSPLGRHFDRLLKGRIDIFSQKSGLSFRRTAPDNPYLALQGEGNAGLQIRFAKRGRLTGSSYRYGAEIYERPLDLDFAGKWWEPNRLRSNFEKLKQSQIPRGYKSKLGAADELITSVQPYMSRVGQPLARDLSNFAEAVPDALRSAAGNTGRFLFEQMERPQRLLADVGFGLRAGSYNKLLHMPFLGEGGFVNNVLSRRAIPVVVGIAGVGYLDYLTRHVASNTLAGLPLKANVLRADATDAIPGARRITDFYANVVPGPQYGPLALPVAGAFAGGLYHYAKVLRGAKTGEYAGEARELGARFFPKLASGAEGVDRLAGEGKGLLARIGETLHPQNLAHTFTEAGHYPGKGLLVGLAVALPFIPGMLGSRRTGQELRDVYSGKEPVAVRAGRWWDFGTSPYEGGRIKEYRPHWYQLFKSRAEIKSLYGSEKEYWSRNPLLHPIRFLRDPYYLEKRHYEDRPYPITSPAFSNVPLVGPLLAATIGKIVKPPVRMHTDTFPGDNYSLYSTRLEPKGGLPPPKPQEEFGLGYALKKEARQFEEFIGLPGFLFHSARTALFPNNDIGQETYFQGSRQIDSVSRRYYERELGAALGPNPGDLSGMFGYSEPLRRFIQREEGIAQVNEVPNTMPDWLPGDDYFVNFRTGDPYAKLNDGFARLPGEGYEALHPEVSGMNPEDYPDMEKLRILGDVAPYSRQFANLRASVERSSRNNTEARIDYEKIVDRVQKMKDSVIKVDERRFTGDTDEAAGTIARSGPGGIELEEYPGRTFHLSSLGYSAADLSALALGARNASKSEIAQQVDAKRSELQQYFEDNLAPGTDVRIVVPKGSLQHATDIRTVVMSGSKNINRDLIASNLALYRKDLGGAEAGSMHSAFGRAIGSLAEQLSFTGDEDTFNPLRYVPTPGHTKLWQERTAYAQYVQQEVVGTKMRRWDRPIHDFVGPYARGIIRRTTGDILIPEDVQHRRDLNSLTNILGYLRDLQLSTQDTRRSGRYTSQAHRTAVGANLFSSPIFVASTLPDRDSIYFRRFLLETDPDKREQILQVVPNEMARALQAQWAGQDAAIAQAEGQNIGPIQEGGRLLTDEGMEQYQQAKTKLGYGDFMRSKEIAEFFSSTGFKLPETGSEVWSDVIDYDDIKLKILQNEGYDRHDFNIFDDRASLLWRKPWLDGAVRELTSGNRQSVENLRRSVEQIMLASGDRNPNVSAVGAASSRALGHVRVDGTINDEDALLQELRRHPEQFDSE